MYVGSAVEWMSLSGVAAELEMCVHTPRLSGLWQLPEWVPLFPKTNVVCWCVGSECLCNCRSPGDGFVKKAVWEIQLVRSDFSVPCSATPELIFGCLNILKLFNEWGQISIKSESNQAWPSFKLPRAIQSSFCLHSLQLWILSVS